MYSLHGCSNRSSRSVQVSKRPSVETRVVESSFLCSEHLKSVGKRQVASVFAQSYIYTCNTSPQLVLDAFQEATETTDTDTTSAI